MRFANSPTPEGVLKQRKQKEYYRSLTKDSIKFLTPLSSPSPFNVLFLYLLLKTFYKLRWRWIYWLHYCIILKINLFQLNNLQSFCLFSSSLMYLKISSFARVSVLFSVRGFWLNSTTSFLSATLLKVIYVCGKLWFKRSISSVLKAKESYFLF